jgi:hypothetical protein
LPSLIDVFLNYFTNSPGIIEYKGLVLLLICFFIISGFFIGYIVTRIVLAYNFSYADIMQAELYNKKAKVDSDLEILSSEVEQITDDSDSVEDEILVDDPAKKNILNLRNPMMHLNRSETLRNSGT